MSQAPAVTMCLVHGIKVITLACRVPGISAVPHEDNLRYFDVEIHGPSQSPYEGMRCRHMAPSCPRPKKETPR
jgi:ubiquitin-protein ligase